MAKILDDLGWMDGIGILGSLLLCIAYAAVSNKWLAADGIRFHAMNLIGALLLLASLCTRPNYGAILIEIVWAAIAAFSLYGIFRLKRRQGQARAF